jgi:hypothetical protein
MLLNKRLYNSIGRSILSSLFARKRPVRWLMGFGVRSFRNSDVALEACFEALG